MKKIVIFCIVLLTLTGCGMQGEASSGVPVVVEDYEDDVVLLDDVKTPLYEEIFATINIGDYYTAVHWGSAADSASYAVPKSGYPGFGFPMLVVVPDVSTGAAIGTEVKVNTLYGTYYYKVDKVCDARISDSGDNVIDFSTESKMINYGKAVERLIVLFSDNKALCANLIHGTKIVVK